jgi:hypothetical protein
MTTTKLATQKTTITASLSSTSSSSDDNTCQAVFQKETNRYTLSRYYYSSQIDDRLFEQSLDVYRPHAKKYPTVANDNDPVIVLVMGSGWLGHVWWIYTGTNWWNASGPQLICEQLGYTCISIRHRGGFFRVPPLSSVVVASTTTCGLLGILLGLWMTTTTTSQEPNIFSSNTILLAGYIYWLLFLWLFWIFLARQGQGAVTTIDEMVQDVEEALGYIQRQRTKLLNHLGDDAPFVLGGYSSGAHVVATWLSSSSSQQRKDDTQAQLLLDGMNVVGILYLSGVLSLNSKCGWPMTMVTWSVFGAPAHTIPSPLGRSPMTPNLRHLLIGCETEVFGWTVLDGTFCAQAYQEWLTSQCNMEARCTLLQGFLNNHWSMLSSQALAQALKDDLPWLLSGNDDKQLQQSNNNNNDTLCGLESSDTSTTTETNSSSDTLSSYTG